MKTIATMTNTGTNIIIAEDIGSYPNTRPELDVRKLRTIHALNIGITNPVFRSISGRNNGYGCGWGDTGKLYPVSEADIAALIAEHDKARQARAAAKAQEDERERAYQNTVGKHICAKCGTFCYGDCTA